MSGIVQGLLASFSSAAAVVTDAYFYLVTLLLNTTSTNGAQNNTFLDSSSNAFTITRNGNATQGTFTPFSQTGWSNFFNGSGDYLQTSSNAAFSFGTSDFTIESWFYASSLTTLASGGNGIFTAIGSVGLYVASDGVRISQSGTAVLNDVTTTISTNTFYHLALTRTGTSMRVFLNGTQVGATITNSTNFSNTGNVRIGTETTQYFSGYISNLRVLKGTAQYTSNFTPPTSPLTAITNTSLLTCQSNRFIDNSTNAFTITTGGTPSVQAFSPFAPAAAYSASVVGGSGYFDGSGDYLTAPAQTALSFAGDFTIECWVYFTTAPSGNYGLLDARASAGTLAAWCWDLFNSTGTKLDFIYGAARLTSASTVPTNQWVHLAVSRSGSTIRQFINGVADANTATTSSAINANRAAIYIGNLLDASTALPGYMAGLRVLNGTGFTSISVPTAPPTAITNTQLLLNFTNSGIYDATAKNDLETVGNAQVSTTQAKFGTTSMYFDGTGDYLSSNAANTDLYAFGSGDFTIEMFIYFNGVASVQCFYDSRPASTQGAYPLIYLNSDGTIRYFVSSLDRITSSAVSANTWYHVAISRSGTSTKMFINGTQAGSTYTDSTTYLNSSLRPFIGVNSNSTNTQYLNGYIDELRVTKGYARYTANFTAPTAAFPVQ